MYFRKLTKTSTENWRNYNCSIPTALAPVTGSLFPGLCGSLWHLLPSPEQSQQVLRHPILSCLRAAIPPTSCAWDSYLPLSNAILLQYFYIHLSSHRPLNTFPGWIFFKARATAWLCTGLYKDICFLAHLSASKEEAFWPFCLICISPSWLRVASHSSTSWHNEWIITYPYYLQIQKELRWMGKDKQKLAQ